MNRKLVGLAIIGAMLLIAPIGRAAEEKPDATVKMTGKALSAGVGYSWGSGTLTYQGKEYPFSISGLSAGNIGASSAELSGEVFNLKNLADFNGNYTSAGAGATVAGGGGGMTMKNQNGVTMNVAGTTRGVSFKLGVDGMKVELKK
ncbi:MAG: DUF1134 domain-containing protein [Verrucomicrobia bacterium]|nr:MAG: DUF1134 domain-containing protein [Verrucomicrobiota bacterium]